MEEKVVKIEIPEGYEIDKEQSTSTQIVCKSIEKKEINRWEDLKSISGYYIDIGSEIRSIYNICMSPCHKDIFLTEEQAKSSLAMAQISQLIPYYGGAISNEEWKNGQIKYTLIRNGDSIIENFTRESVCFLAFHTKEQRDLFLKYNERLVKDYLMID